MQIGDIVIFQGRAFVLRGHDPMSVPDRQAEIVDLLTGERLFAPLAELAPAPPEPDGFSPAA